MMQAHLSIDFDAITASLLALATRSCGADTGAAAPGVHTRATTTGIMGYEAPTAGGNRFVRRYCRGAA